MTATNLLTNVTLAENGDSGLWGDIGGGQGSGQDANAPLEGLECRARRVDANTRGFGVSNGVRDLSAAGMHFGLWVRTFQPGALTAIDMRLGGSATGPDNTPYSNWQFDGADFPREGPWIRVWVDPSVARDSGAGTLNINSVQWFAANYAMGNVSGSAQNCLIDRVDFGVRGIEITGAGGTFSEAETLDQTQALGILRDGELNGTIRLKNGTFDDTNFSIRAGNQPLAATDWIKIDCDNTDAGNGVTFGAYFLEGILITVSGTVGALDFGTGTMLAAPAMTWNSSVTFAGNLTASNKLDANGAALSGITITDSLATEAVAVGNLSQLVGATITKTGFGRAVDLGTVSASITMTWDVDTSGYDAGVSGTNVTTTNTGDEDILVNVAAGQTLTINVAAGRNAPSVTNTGSGQVDILVAQEPITITFNDESGSPIPNVRVYVYTVDNLQELFSGTTDVNGQVTSSYGGSTPRDIRGWGRDYDLAGVDYVEGSIVGTIEGGAGFAQTVIMEAE